MPGMRRPHQPPKKTPAKPAGKLTGEAALRELLRRKSAQSGTLYTRNGKRVKKLPQGILVDEKV